ncbi:PLP-dependent aminotransferase family protein [Phreatobacter stygius]|uniref:PLP-dependent aminotransferase family protein n=1 Tax=Phreatobacter stygius TaxID=1940610 RepID=A0A4D7BDS5_9HYPH|nr:PLP-dependent aminotransferase family protein [Phreatobacter stygius]QCI67496.1 PLP-dependent aminotransferase family protein [Phreatobacter stygius]
MASKTKGTVADLAWASVFPPREAGDRLSYVAIMRAVIQAIEDRRLARGTRLPSGRDLARMLKIGRNTAMLAYGGLVEQGYLVVRPRSGVVVAERLPGPAPPTVDAAGAVVPDWRGRFKIVLAEDGAGAPRAGDEPAYPFTYGQFDPSLFPTNHWRECERAALSVLEIAQWGRDVVDEDDVELVEQLRRHILPHHGIWARPDEIIITLGGQQARYLVAQLLAGRDTVVGMENPGLADFRHILGATAARIRELAIDAGGLVVSEALDSCDYVYVSGGHQCPTTAVMPAERRLALLERAADKDFIVIEDSYDNELLREPATLAALKGLDRHQRVIHIGSLSKLVAPGLRLGFIVAPAVVIRQVRALRRLIHRHPPGNNQRALAIFIERGYYRGYLRRAAKALSDRSLALDQALRRWMPAFAWRHSPGASSFWVEGPEGFDCRRTAAVATAKGVQFDSGDRFFHGPDPCRRFMRLGVSSIAVTRIDAGIRALAEAARECQP